MRFSRGDRLIALTMLVCIGLSIAGWISISRWIRAQKESILAGAEVGRTSAEVVAAIGNPSETYTAEYELPSDAPYANLGGPVFLYTVPFHRIFVYFDERDVVAEVVDVTS